MRRRGPDNKEQKAWINAAGYLKRIGAAEFGMILKEGHVGDEDTWRLVAVMSTGWALVLKDKNALQMDMPRSRAPKMCADILGGLGGYVRSGCIDGVRCRGTETKLKLQTVEVTAEYHGSPIVAHA